MTAYEIEEAYEELESKKAAVVFTDGVIRSLNIRSLLGSEDTRELTKRLEAAYDAIRAEQGELLKAYMACC